MAVSYCITTCQLISKQYTRIKSSIVDINNCLNGTFLAFDSLNQEFSPGSCLIDNFPNHFSFHLASCKDADAKTAHCNKLKKLYKKSSNNQNTILIISNMSVKNNITNRSQAEKRLC